jgi:hypothetical protein
MLHHGSGPLRIVWNVARFSCVFTVAGCGVGTPRAVGAPATVASDTQPPPSTLVTLERRPCFGTCPVYVVSIAGDGSVVFEGRAHVDSARRITSHIDASSVAAIVRLFDDSEFFTLDDKYIYGEQNCPPYAWDAPIVITSLAKGDRTKRVEHDQGCGGAPGKLTLLENRIDEIAQVWRWTTGQPPQ